MVAGLDGIFDFKGEKLKVISFKLCELRAKITKIIEWRTKVFEHCGKHFCSPLHICEFYEAEHFLHLFFRNHKTSNRVSVQNA